MTIRSVLTRRSRAILAAALLAATAAGCAQTDPSPTSGSTTPGAAPINFQGYPYNVQAGS